MARKINVRKILDELIKKASHNSIASSWHISKHSVSDVAAKGLEPGILPEGPVPDMDDDSLYKLFFPEKITAEEVHEPVDFEKVHEELNRPGVTLKLLRKEYKIEYICILNRIFSGLCRLNCGPMNMRDHYSLSKLRI